MQVKLWRPVSSPPVTGRKANRAPGRPVFRLWRNVDEERQQKHRDQQQGMLDQRAGLSDRKAELLAMRKTLAPLKQRCSAAAQALEAGQLDEAYSTLLGLLRDPALAPWQDRQELAALKLYLFQEKGLLDRMLEVADSAIDGLDFAEDNFPVFYEVAVLHQEAGDPARARAIFQRFVDGMYLDFRDVAQRARQ